MVRQAQQRLTDLGFWSGAVDGQFGSRTAHAIIAFEKWNRLPLSGQASAQLIAELERAERPEPRLGGTGLEIDLARQVALLVVNGQVRWALDTSTGKASTPTPVGTFTIERQIDGNRYAPLGTLYRPKYFIGGYALHGYSSVPTYPASHGCVRLTFAAMDLLWAEGFVEIGTRVTVY